VNILVTTALAVTFAHGPAVTVASPVVHVPPRGAAYETVSARFPVCVTDVTAYAEPASGDYEARSGTHYGTVAAGRIVKLRFRLTRADETGRWFVTGVYGWSCARPGDLAGAVTGLYGAVFRVTFKR
jgi:hypothetical protein